LGAAVGGAVGGVLVIALAVAAFCRNGKKPSENAPHNYIQHCKTTSAVNVAETARDGASAMVASNPAGLTVRDPGLARAK
jgi:hypothetical protein